MGSRELQLASEPPLVIEKSRNLAGSAVEYESSEASFIFDVIRKWWWLLGMCVLLSVPIAYFAAMQFGAHTALCRGSLMYTGLPIPPGPKVYQPPTLATYREILFSTPNMQRICDRHGLDMPPTILADLFKCTVQSGSSIMELSLQWPDVDDGIALVNDTMQMLVDEAARQRQEILREYTKHVESAELAAKSDVDKALEDLRIARRKRDEQLSKGGVTGDKYTSALGRITNTQASLDSLHVNQLGVEQQIARLDAKGKEIVKALCRAQVDARKSIIQELAKPHSKGSQKWTELGEIYSQLQAISKKEPLSPTAYWRWKAELAAIGRGALADSATFATEEMRQQEGQLSGLLNERDKLELTLIPIANQMTLLKKRLADYEQEANEFANDIAGISSSDFEEVEKKVEMAEKRADLFKQQLDNLRQLEECRAQEFSISMPASLQTTEVDSNKKRVFALWLAASAVLLCAPVFGLAWLSQRESPVAKFASRWGLPVIAERLLANYPAAQGEPPDWRTDESVRMTTLRIQQCMSSPGCVVLFSGLGKMSTPVQLMSSIAACLAHREERVLIVDAIDPADGVSLSANFPVDRRPTTHHSTPPGREAHRSALAQPLTAGLSEYLSRECEGVVDLIQPTACPGVDMITSGVGAFPSEAMASSCVTELFDHCRKTYSIILVAGPPVVARADFQMLAARADAILLAATRAAVHDPVSRYAVQDLIDLRAPVIGVIA